MHRKGVWVASLWISLLLGLAQGQFYIETKLWAWTCEIESVGFSLYGCSINSDSYRDIVTVGQSGPYALLGKANLSSHGGAPDWTDGSLNFNYYNTSSDGPALACVDVTGDGLDDIIVGDYYYRSGSVGGRVLIYNGNTTGTPLATVSRTVQQSNSSVVGLGRAVITGDFNGDTGKDLAISTSDSGQVFVYLSSSTTGPNWSNAPVQIAAPTAPTTGWGKALGAGDFNGDGRSDLVVGWPTAGSNNGALYVYYGSAGSLDATSDWSATGSGAIQLGYEIAVGNLDGDSYSDILTIAKGASGVLYYYEGNSIRQGSNAAKLININGTPRRVAFLGTFTTPDLYEDFAVSITGFGMRAYAGQATITSPQTLAEIFNKTGGGSDAWGVANLGNIDGISTDELAFASMTSLIGNVTIAGNFIIPTPSPSVTPSVTPSITPSNSPSKSPSRTPSVSPSISTSPSVTPSITPTPSVTPSVTPTPSRTPSISGSPSVSPTISPSNSVTPSVTPSITPSRTPTPSTSVTPSITPSNTPSPSVTPSISPSNSISPTPSVTPSPSRTPSVTPSITPSNTPSPSVTPSITPTPSVTPSNSRTPSVTPSITPTPSVTPSNSRTPSTSPSSSPSMGASPSTTPSTTPSRSPSSSSSSSPSRSPSASTSASGSPSVTPTVTPSSSTITLPSESPDPGLGSTSSDDATSGNFNWVPVVAGVGSVCVCAFGMGAGVLYYRRKKKEQDEQEQDVEL